MAILNINNILKLIPQETIMQRYFPANVMIGSKYTNPFRVDATPGCYFAYTSRGTLNFFDHANPDFGGDCFKVAMMNKGVSFKQALELINEDFNLGLNVKYEGLSPYREDYISTLRLKEQAELKKSRPIINRRKSHFKIQADRKSTRLNSSHH